MLQEVNETASRLPTVDMAVYLLNCMHQIQSTLALYEYMDQRLERLQVIGANLIHECFMYIIVKIIVK